MKTLSATALGLWLGLYAGGLCAGQLDLGAQFQGWTTNYSEPAGHELLVPLSLSLNPWKDVNLYAQGEFANGVYSDSINGTQTLTDFSDTVVGGAIGFTSFSLPSMLNIGVNLPTGNQSWETQTSLANIPAEFVDWRYEGRGFGLSAIYGVALPAGDTQYGVGLGYLYSGAFNPNDSAGISAGNLKLGDSLFFSLNRVTSFSSNQTEAITASAYLFMPTLQQNQQSVWMGPNFNLSYRWADPTAFSFEAGVQYYLPAQTSVNGSWETGTHNAFGTRFYVNPVAAFGDFTLSGRLKYIQSNGYAPGEAFYDGGGFLAGIEPSYKFTLDSQSALNLSASYDNITARRAGVDPLNNVVDIIYNRWTVGADYEVKL
jgi:hypothetical protein